MSVSYLLDAETDGDAVKLKFYDMSAGEIKEFKDSEYKPYFLTSYPLSKKDEYTLERIVGKASTVEKHDLFTDKKRIMTKIEIKNPNNLERFSRMFENVWENEIEFSRGCVYDHGLVFGSPYILHGNRFIEASTISEDIKKKFESIFALIRTSDPLKYSLLEYWFNLCHQPIPQVEPEILGISGKADPERFYLAFMLARIANLPVSEAYSSRRVSDWIKSIIYTYLRRNNILVPTSKELRRGAQLKRSVAGALTIAPRSGVYFNTVVTDFESLYPSCIDSYNLSYETVDCEHTECESNTVSEAGHHVCTRRRGFYSALIGALKDMRIHWFKPLSKNPNIPDDKRRLAEASAKLLKLITVSSYGVTVRIHGLASTPLAESITGYGRYVLQTSWNMAEVNGLRPTYGDTDSLFLHNPSEEQVKWLIKTVKEKLRLDLAVEKRYSVCVLPKAKKAYFGILEDGAPDIKGLTVIKSNSPEFFLHVFRDCVKELSHVKNMEEYEAAKERIVSIVEEAVKNLRQRKVELKDLVYSVRLYFDPMEKLGLEEALHQPYQCAVQLIDSGREVSSRDTVFFVKVNPFNYKGRRFTVKPADHVKSVSEINVEDYVRNLRTALAQTFDPMNIKFEAERKREMKISEWFRGEN